MAKLSKILENESFQGFVFAVVLLGIVSVPYIIAQPHQARLQNSREICHASGGAVWVKPYPQLEGVPVIVISNDEACANIALKASLSGKIRAALNAK